MRQHTLFFAFKLLVLYAFAAFLFFLPDLQRLSIRHASIQAGATEIPNPPAQEIITGEPTHLTIPVLKLDLPIVIGHYSSSEQRWSIGEHTVGHAATSPNPNNEVGTTVLYGHNTLAVFYSTKNLQPGDEALVTTRDGSVLVYEFVRSEYTTPTDTSILSVHAGSPQLVLLTCDGLSNNERRLMYFSLKSAHRNES